jgi:hypothetical protein
MSHAAAKLLRDPTLDKFTAPRVGRVLPEFAPPVREPKIRLEFGVREHMPGAPRALPKYVRFSSSYVTAAMVAPHQVPPARSSRTGQTSIITAVAAATGQPRVLVSGSRR